MSKLRRDAFYAMYDAIHNTLYKLSCGDTIVGDATEKHDAVIELENAIKDAEEVLNTTLQNHVHIRFQTVCSVCEKTEALVRRGGEYSQRRAPVDALWAIARTILLDRVPPLYQQLK